MRTQSSPSFPPAARAQSSPCFPPVARVQSLHRPTLTTQWTNTNLRIKHQSLNKAMSVKRSCGLGFLRSDPTQISFNRVAMRVQIQTDNQMSSKEPSECLKHLFGHRKTLASLLVHPLAHTHGCNRQTQHL